MFSNRARVLASLAASIKASALLGLDTLRSLSFKKAGQAVRLAIHEHIANTRTPGAFGSATPPKRNRRPKWMRANMATVRGY